MNVALPTSRALPTERIVCEIADGRVPPGFHWYEEALDDQASRQSSSVLVPSGAGLIAATHSTDRADSWVRVQAALAQDRFSCVLFEFLSEDHARQTITAARERGVMSIATRHLPPAAYTLALLMDELRILEDSGAEIVKIAYPATSPAQVAAGLEALECAHATISVPTSVTPMGTRWGRVAAAAAGSCLVFAPMASTPDRQSAEELRRTLESLTDPAGR